MTASFGRPIKLFGCFLLLSLSSLTPRTRAADANDFFETKIRPLLSVHCLSCHGTQVQMAGLNLATEASFLKGSEKGPVVQRGDPENSRLIQAVRYLKDIKMPPTGKLTAQQIADLTEWVQLGAPWPSAQTAGSVGKDNEKWSPSNFDFWSFHPVKAQSPPAVGKKTWVKSPIDNFVLAKLQTEGLTAANPASKLTLLRRATFDLTGLPPSEGEIQEFLADDSPKAFEKVVERLLASPRYGERWGRHWLDVARYGDSTGGDEDFRNPYAWRYRDYVIQAFNRDLPYDQFILEQIAGDLLPAERPGEVNVRGIVATGFLALGPKLLSEADKPKVLYDIIDEQIDVTSRALMGLTVACARCHDHKFDPIPTEDYYSLASIFASTKQLSKLEGITSKIYLAPLVPKDIADRYEEYQKKITAKNEAIGEIVEEEGDRHVARLSPRLADYMVAARKVYGSNISAQEIAATDRLELKVLEKWIEYLKPSQEVRPHLERWYQASTADQARIAQDYQREFELTTKEWSETRADWKRKVAAALKEGTAPPEKPKLKAGKNRFFSDVALGKGPLALPEKEQEQESLFSQQSNERLATLRAELAELKKAAPPEPPMACAVAEGENTQQRVFVRGNYQNPAQEVPKRFPRVLSKDPEPPIVHGSGRLELARWLASPSHPLTARVMVNRIWQWHFGEGLVRTPSNFGKLGEPPTHPELLDYLAQQFVASGWSIKAMHRLIMMSGTYRMSSAATPQQIQTDPVNRFWSHFAERRLDVEEIRDSLLSVAGSLDLTIGGSLLEGTGIVHDVENDPVARVSLDPAKSRRRTVYLPLRRSNLPSLLTLFDFGDAVSTGESRTRTNVAPQALFMLNSRFVAERAADFAQLLLADKSADDRRRVERAIWIMLTRKPAVQEIDAALGYIDGMEKKRGGEDARLNAWQSYCRILMSSNEFVYID